MTKSCNIKLRALVSTPLWQRRRVGDTLDKHLTTDFIKGSYLYGFNFVLDDVIWASLWENRLFAYAKTKTQISFAVTAKLISAFVYATRIVQFLYFLNPKFQASSYLLWLYSPVCVGPGRKPRRPVFSEGGSFNIGITVYNLEIVIWISRCSVE